MPKTKTDAVDHYARHAKLYGTELVFETAYGEGWPVSRLGALSLKLQDIDPGWRLGAAEVNPPSTPAAVQEIYGAFRDMEYRHDPEHNRRRRQLWRNLDRLRSTTVRFDQVAFAQDLIDAGIWPNRACRMAMISRKTLRRAELHREGRKVPEWGTFAPYPRGAEWTNPGPPTQTPSTPDLSIVGPQNGSQPAAPIPGQLTMYEVEEGR